MLASSTFRHVDDKCCYRKRRTLPVAWLDAMAVAFVALFSLTLTRSQHTRHYHTPLVMVVCSLFVVFVGPLARKKVRYFRKSQKI